MTHDAEFSNPIKISSTKSVVCPLINIPYRLNTFEALISYGTSWRATFRKRRHFPQNMRNCYSCKISQIWNIHFPSNTKQLPSWYLIWYIPELLVFFAFSFFFFHCFYLFHKGFNLVMIRLCWHSLLTLYYEVQHLLEGGKSYSGLSINGAALIWDQHLLEECK